jgi:Cu/Zn superoxide dismutase
MLCGGQCDSLGDLPQQEVDMSTAIRILGTIAAGIAVSALAAGTATADGGAIPMNDEQEAPGAVSDGSGFFSYTVSGTELCYTLEVRNLTGDPIAAHIHLAPRHSPGPVVVPLSTPPAATSSVSDCITAAEGGAMTPAELAAITADPKAYYVNVHTDMWKAGEVRGQLKK